MGLLATIFNPRPVAAAPGPLDDFWYQPMGFVSTAGVRVDADAAMKSSVVFACVDLLASVVGMLPLMLYRRQPDGGKERADDQPLYTVLHDQPNAWQTAREFREMLMQHVLLRGNGYALIVPGPGGFADQLIPLNPDRVQAVKASDEPSETRLLYTYQRQSGPKMALNSDEVFHLRGLSADGVVGLSVITYAREAIGLSLATEEYGNRFFSQGSAPPGTLNHPGKMTKDGAKRLRQEWQELHRGLGNAHEVAVLEEGMEFKTIGIKPEDAQMIATREFTVEDISRFFRVPLHMINSITRATSWGTGIEAQAIGFTTFTLMRWLTMWKETYRRDLILDKEQYFADFAVEQLLKGDTPARYQAYAMGRQWGWLSVNDIRERENMDPIGEDGDVYLQPLNMGPAGTPAEMGGATVQDAPDGDEPPPGDETVARATGEDAQDMLHTLVHDAAARLVHKEIAAMTRAARRSASAPALWVQAVGEFYADHAAFVAQQLHITPAAAERYVAEQVQALNALGAAAMHDWETRRVDDLIALAFDGKDVLRP